MANNRVEALESKTTQLKAKLAESLWALSEKDMH
jgi:hypothetical protein